MVQPAQEAPMKSALSWTPYPDPLSGELWGTSASYTSSMMRRLFANGPVSCRSEEHTSELQSLMRISYAVFCLKKKKQKKRDTKLPIYTTVIYNTSQVSNNM